MNNTSGILLVNKTSGPTSHDVVALARKVFGIREIGHTGTLDPIASGLLILTIGKANKLSQYLMEGEKGYRVTVRLGLTTDTLDRTGKTLSKTEVCLTDAQIQSAIHRLQGVLELKVPNFSAVKVDGEKLYEMARKNKVLPEVKREMTFFDVQFLERNGEEIVVTLRCTKGGYVRSWVDALGKELGCGAAVQELHRFYNAPYEVSQALELRGQKLDDILQSTAWIPFEQILPSWPRIVAHEDELRAISHGQIPVRLQTKAQQVAKDAPVTAKGLFIVRQGSEEILCFLEFKNPLEPPTLKKVFIQP